MVNVRYGWLHLPQFCRHPDHEPCFASGERSMTFLDEQEALSQIARWNGGPGRCHQFTPFDIEKIPHGTKSWD